MNIVQANQDQVWSETDDFSLERYAQFAKYLPPGVNRVLDCGCNIGRGGAILKKHHPNLAIWGIDLLEERIARVPAGIYQQLFVGSALQVPLADDSLDAIVAGEMVEHIPAEQMAPLFNEFRRVLRRGGLVLLTTPNPASYLVNIRKEDIFSDPSHVNIMSRDEITAHLKKADFGAIRMIGSGKVSRYLGEEFPLPNVYGSYLAIAERM